MANVCHTKPALTYESWIAALRLDPEIKADILELIPADVLVEWWEQGLCPTRKCIAEAAEAENYRTNRLESAS
jgi:hypothetical protein